MDVTETAGRLVGRYWLVVALAIAAPMTAVGVYVGNGPTTYTAHTRLLAAPTVPQAQAQADAVVSQVQAVATSRDLVAAALAGSGIHRDPAAIVKSIGVAGVGSSGLVDLSYTDTSATIAQRVDTAVANLVVTRLLALRAGVPELVQNLNGLIAALGSKRAAVVATAHASPRSEALVTSMDDVIGAMTADRERLDAFGQNGASVAIVDTATVPPADSTALVAKLAVALLLGLALGLLIVGLNETLRPRVVGVARVARLLDVPVLGRVGSDLAATSDIGRRLRLSSRREGITSVVLMHADGTPVAPELASRLRIVTLTPPPMPRQWSIGLPVAEATVSSNGGGVNVGSAAMQSTLTAPTAEPVEARPRHVICLDELDASSEGERIGLVVIAGRTTRTHAISDVRDLIGTTGWPLLGVLADPQNRSGMR